MTVNYQDYNPNGMPNSERAIKEAAENDLEVKFPTAKELFIDIDSDQQFEVFKRNYDIVRKFIGVDEQYIDTSGNFYRPGCMITPSRRKAEGKHIVVLLTNPVNEIERVGLQAMLGSDRMRELLGYVQAKNNDPHPTLFLEKKGTERKFR